MVRYPVVLEPDDNDTVLASFPDFPEAHTFGDTREEALARAQDALATVIDGYVRARRSIPDPSAISGESVELPALSSAKIELYCTMRRRGVTKAELGRRLKAHLPQVDRLFNLGHSSRIDQLEAAAAALDAKLVVSVQGRAPSRAAAATSRRKAVAPRRRLAVHPHVMTTVRRRSGRISSKKR